MWISADASAGVQSNRFAAGLEKGKLSEYGRCVGPLIEVQAYRPISELPDNQIFLAIVVPVARTRDEVSDLNVNRLTCGL